MEKLASVRLTLALSIISILNVASLFAVQGYVILKIGPGNETDALFASFTLPQFFLSVVSDSLVSILVPFFSRENEESFPKLVWGFLIAVGVLFGVIAIVLFTTVTVWVPLLFPGFTPETVALIVTLSRIQVFTMFFTALWGVLWAACHSQKRFIRAEISTLLTSVIGLILAIILLPRFGVVSISWITLLRYALQALLLLPIAGKFIKPDFNNVNFRKAWQIVRPLLLGTMFYKTSPIVNRFFASMAPSGGLSLFYLSQQIYTASLEVLSKAIVAPLIPRLAVLAKHEEWQTFRRVYRNYLLITFCLPLAAYLILIVFGERMLHILTIIGTIDSGEVRLFWILLVALGGVPVAGGMGQVLASSYYARSDTVTPTLVGTIGYAIGIVMMTIGFVTMGLRGMAIGTSVYYLLNALVMYLILERKLREQLSSTS